MTSFALSRSRKPLAVAGALFVALAIAAAGQARADGPGRGPAGGPPGPGGLVEHALESMKDKLALDTSQQVMFDRISAQTIAARDQAIASHAAVRTKVDAELAKAEPDLGAVSAILESAEDQGRAARRQVRDQWLGFYANLRPDQKAIVRDAIKDRFAHMDDMRQRMRDRAARRAS